MQKRNAWHLMARSQQKGGVERFKGFYISDGKTDETPLSFAVTDLHTHHLNDLKCFERAYKMGFQSDEHKKQTR